MPHGAVGNPFHQHPDQGRARHCDDNGRQERQFQCRSAEVSDIGTHHIDITVGEVDQFQYAVNHRIPQGNQCVDAAKGKTVDELLGKLMHKT